jgi:hypothetical protein
LGSSSDREDCPGFRLGIGFVRCGRPGG